MATQNVPAYGVQPPVEQDRTREMTDFQVRKLEEILHSYNFFAEHSTLALDTMHRIARQMAMTGYLTEDAINDIRLTARSRWDDQTYQQFLAAFVNPLRAFMYDTYLRTNAQQVQQVQGHVTERRIDYYSQVPPAESGEEGFWDTFMFGLFKRRQRRLW